MAAPSDWSRFLAAIRAQESGGNYTENVAGCLGAYCWNAQSNWDEMAAVAGQTNYVGINPSQVPPSVQDKVASSNLSKIYQQAGGGTAGLSAAARWWNGGQTQSVPNPGLPSQSWAPKCGGGSSGAYACQVLTRMGLGGHYLAGPGSGSGGTVVLTSVQQASCAIGMNNANPLPSWIPVLGQQINICLLPKSGARALYGGLLIVGGAFLVLVGLGFVGFFTVPVVGKVARGVTKQTPQPSGGGSGKPAGGGGAPAADGGGGGGGGGGQYVPRGYHQDSSGNLVEDSPALQRLSG